MDDRPLYAWRFAKTRYRSLVKNANRTFAMLAMINLVKWGVPLTGQVRPARANSGEYPRFRSQYRPFNHEFFVPGPNSVADDYLISDSLALNRVESIFVVSSQSPSFPLHLLATQGRLSRRT